MKLSSSNCRFSGLIVLALCFFTCTAIAQKETPPNIVLFLVDDMGWQDTSVPFWKEKTDFNKQYYTPNMERLASEGMKFTQAYATPVCSPSRVSLMTGVNAAKHRVTNWTLRKNQLQPMELNHATLQFPIWNVNGITPDKNLRNAIYATTLPQQLKQAGYFTIHAGKAHFGAVNTPAADPRNIGFDVNIGGHAAGGPGSYYGMDGFGKTKKDWAVPGLEAYHDKDIFLTEVLTIEVKKAMDVAISKEQPFFLHMAHYAVHAPIQGDDRFLQKYLDRGMDPKEAKYATLVEGMDKSLGDIMDYLKAHNLEENTIILFMSDNGGLSAHARGGEANTHNRPLASGKGSIYEGGIREPMLVKWVGKVKPKTTNDQYLIIEDFYPTILEMAGISEYTAVQEIDGVSFLPLLNTAMKTDKRALFWHYPNEWGVSGPGIGASSAVRLGDYKLIYFHVNQKIELYNLKEDIGEYHDLSTTLPEKVKELATVLSAYLIKTEAQMPVYRKSGKLVPMPIDIIAH